MNKNVLEPFNYIYRNELFKNFERFMDEKESHDLTIDNVSIYSLITKGYIVGNNTLINELYRNEWAENIDINLSQYNSIYKDVDDIASDLILLLKEEIINEVINFKNIYILLSGGMDSRVLAALLYDLQKDGQLEKQKIHAITWGMENSRDVIYARKIANRYQWKWHHLNLSEEVLDNNLLYSVNKLGGEVAPIHLHRYIDAGTLANNSDSIILAGTYGDSLGRGEYSGVKVSDLSLMTLNDRFGIFNDTQEKLLHEKNMIRLKHFRDRFNIFNNEWKELEYQSHYLHKMLYNASTLVNYNSKIFQLFSTKKVIEYIFSLKFECRTDSVYKEILQKVDSKLLELSWARTGKGYLQDNERPDDLNKNHHNYPGWIKKNYSKDILIAINSTTIKNLGIFDIKQLNRLYKIWRFEKSGEMSNLTNVYMTILMIKIFIEKFDLLEENIPNNETIGIRRVSKKKLKGLLTESLIVMRGYFI